MNGYYFIIDFINSIRNDNIKEKEKTKSQMYAFNDCVSTVVFSTIFFFVVLFSTFGLEVSFVLMRMHINFLMFNFFEFFFFEEFVRIFWLPLYYIILCESIGPRIKQRNIKY